MELRHKLQQSIGTCTSTGEQDVDYRLTTNGLIRFRDRIYVLDDSEINKPILREFHVKP